MKHLRSITLLAMILPAVPVQADEVLPGNVIAQGSTCVGALCANGEGFSGLPGDGYLKLKGTRPVLEFEDTSDNGAPTTDWRLYAGFSSTDAFIIRNNDVGVNPFVITPDAIANSLYIAANGDIGMGTMFPFRDLHIRRLDTPGIRFDQIGVGQMPNQQWEIYANDLFMAFKDFTEDTTPFAIATSAPDDALFVSGNGNIGAGTDTPDVPFHVVENAGTATDVMRLENNGGVVFRLKDTSPGGQEFTFQSNGGIFRIASPAVPGPEFTMDDFGNVTIKGEITTAGSCSAGCDRVFDEDYDLPKMEAHHAAMWELGHLPNVGPTAEDGPMNLSEKVGGILNELEHAHIYIHQLQIQSKSVETSLRNQIEAQNKIIAGLQARLDTLEAQN